MSVCIFKFFMNMLSFMLIKVFGLRGSMVARMKLKGIYGRAPPRGGDEASVKVATDLDSQVVGDTVDIRGIGVC